MIQCNIPPPVQSLDCGLCPLKTVDYAVTLAELARADLPYFMPKFLEVLSGK